MSYGPSRRRHFPAEAEGSVYNLYLFAFPLGGPGKAETRFQCLSTSPGSIKSQGELDFGLQGEPVSRRTPKCACLYQMESIPSTLPGKELSVCCVPLDAPGNLLVTEQVCDGRPVGRVSRVGDVGVEETSRRIPSLEFPARYSTCRHSVAKASSRCLCSID